LLCCSHECELGAQAHPKEAIAKVHLLVHRHETRIRAGSAR
jgi:hypothetical protein